MTVAHINTIDGLEKAFGESGDKLVVVDYFANWCGPCVSMGPKVEAMSSEFDGKVTISKLLLSAVQFNAFRPLSLKLTSMRQRTQPRRPKSRFFPLSFSTRVVKR